jgi:hypothetical protein
LRIINLIYDYNLCGIFSCPKLTRIGITVRINGVKLVDWRILTIIFRLSETHLTTRQLRCHPSRGELDHLGF